MHAVVNVMTLISISLPRCRAGPNLLFLQGARYLDPIERNNLVSLLKFTEIFETNTALHALADLAHVLLEMLERLHSACH